MADKIHLHIENNRELGSVFETTPQRLEAALKAHAVPHEAHFYPGTQHGFHNNSTPRYQEAAAKLAWDRTVAWFRRYLA